MSDTRATLAETLRQINTLLGASARQREQVLNVASLSQETGIAAPTIQALLDGRRAPDEDFDERMRERFINLRTTRLRDDGKPYSYEEIATSFGRTGAALRAFARGDIKSLQAETAAGIEQFYFGRATAYLSSDSVQVLDGALQNVLHLLQQELDPLAGVMEKHAVRHMALRRAEGLPEAQWRVVEATLNALLDQVEDDQ